MPTPVTQPRLSLALAAVAVALSLTANADDQDIRIGRYQAVVAVSYTHLRAHET